MEVKRFDITGPIMFTPKKITNDRGCFIATFKQKFFNDTVGEDIAFVQENYSFSHLKDTVRGLHCQHPPYAQGKLVKCTRGRIVDVVVDIRTGSYTFGQYLKVELTSRTEAQLWVPEGFLHGFRTLEAETEVQYKCTNYYAPKYECNVAWNDPDLKIDWGTNTTDVVLSEKDIDAKPMKNFESPF